MALRVLCPGGCRLQVPKSRAGMMVRCPKCSKIIRIANFSNVTEGDDGMQSLTASLPSEEELTLYRQRSGQVRQPEVRRKVVRRSSDGIAAGSQPTQSKAAGGDENARLPGKKPSPDNSFESEIAGKRRWRMPGEKSEFEQQERLRRKRKAAGQKNPPLQSELQKPDTPRVETTDDSTDEQRKPLQPPESNKSSAVVETSLAVDAVRSIGVMHDRQSKLRGMFLSLTLVVIGIFLIIPAVSPFMVYVQSGSQSQIPRWAAWLVFLGLLQFVYAVYACQLADWTSLWSVAIMMLVATMVTAFLLAGLALSPPGGFVSRLFQIPNSQTMRAEIWLTMLLLIVSLVGWLSGREAFRWKRREVRSRQNDAATT